MTRLKLKVILLSITITSGLSTLFGFAGSTIIGPFWSWFWISLLIQFLGFIVYNSFLIQRDNIALQEAEVEAMKQIAKISIKIGCAYCQRINITPIQLNKKNTFKCESCNQVNGISMNFIATTITTPLETVKIPTGDTEHFDFKVTS